MNDFTYKVIRSRRRTMEIQIKNGEVIVRASVFCTEAHIRRFVASHHRWIESRLARVRKMQQEADACGAMTEEEIKVLTMRAKELIPERVRYYAPKVGVSYGRVTIRHQKTRWGSCSSKGNLNFNCLLMLAPPEVLDSVVVHELCHRKEMNHSRRFYAEVLRVFPDYYKWHKWLKENGDVLLRRMFGSGGAAGL